MSDSGTEIQIAKGALRRFIQNAERKKRVQQASLLQTVKKATPEFRNRFKTVHHLGLVGSFAKKGFYSLRSDLDILVGGLKKDDYFKAFLFWERRLPVAIDLIREEEAGEHLKFLSRHEVILFEKD